MEFTNRITRHPIAHNATRGDEVLAAVAPPVEAGPLVQGAAGSSPFLAASMGKEASWLRQSLDRAPEDVIAELVTEAASLTASELNKGLRRIKRRAGLVVALADLGGVWDLATVTQNWTDLADGCVGAALKTHVAIQARRGKIPGQTEEDAARDGAGMIALAMGKMGAGELNYSSDIDLICLFDASRFDGPAEEMEARAAFIKATRAMAASLSDLTGDGYVFRTDLRLRPDPSVTPVCISMAAAERYYEAEGRTWERSAYIKARPCAGDLDAGARFLQDLVPFVWRKHLDFATVAETMDMRQRIKDHKGLHDRRLEGRNLKLSAGGIRDIEFFAQTRQLVAGGRDPALRVPGTVSALEALAGAEWISQEDASELRSHYAALREAEHRVQMIDDAQTHTLPKSDEGFDRLARLSGEGDTAKYRDALAQRMTEVERITGDLYRPKTSAEMPVVSDAANDVMARWPSYPALRSERGQLIFERLKPALLAKFQTAARPDEALSNFDGFLRGLPAGVQLFSLFEANPTLVDLIGDICATAPALARYLSRNSSVLDAVLDGQFFAEWPGEAALGAELRAVLEPLDYEDQLNAARRWQRDWHFRVGVHLLRGIVSPAEAAGQYSALAGACVAALWPAVCTEVARRHGPAPGRGGVVLGMGSLGATEMTAGSDLDLIVIFDAGDVELTDGRRPLDPRGWFAKATKALITALSAPTGEGKLYDVDLRLRPSGRQGPVATSLSAFVRYQAEEAWTWEHMALTRARAVAGDAGLARDVEAARREVIARRKGDNGVRDDAAEMRRRLAEAGRTGGTWLVKDGPGGLQDMALLSQAEALVAGSAARSVPDQIAASDLPQGLAEVHNRFATVNQAARLLSDGPLEPDTIGEGGRDFLARLLGMPETDALVAQLDSDRHAASSIVDEYLGSNEGSDHAS